jgi:hypothetical protein
MIVTHVGRRTYFHDLGLGNPPPREVIGDPKADTPPGKWTWQSARLPAPRVVCPPLKAVRPRWPDIKQLNRNQAK